MTDPLAPAAPLTPADAAVAPTPEVAVAVTVEVEPTDGGGHSLSAVHLIALIIGLATCWAAADLLVPIMLAAFLALIANPLVTRLCKFWLPRWLSALLVVVGGLAAVVFLASLLIGPAATWMEKAPEAMRELAPKMRSLAKKVDDANQAAESIATAAGASAEPDMVVVAGESASPRAPNIWALVWSTPRLLAGGLAVVLLAYFFLVHGERLQRSAIDLFSDRGQRKQAVEILRAIESDVAAYVMTISVINLILGALTAGALYWLGLDLTDALLWGAVAGLLNYMPYVGPLFGVVALGLVGVIAFDTPAKMFMPAAIYLGLQLLESEIITPLVLGRRMSLSPLVMLLWLLLWGWLWGIAGVFLAVPMLASLKILAERVDGWQGWAKVIG